MKINHLFSKVNMGSLTLKNKVVMAPMTRCRAIGSIPNELMAQYYKQRSGAGLIITEGTSPSKNGLGYARIPGIFSDAQVDGWTKVCHAVHEGDAKIFIQLMHTGRIGHQLNLPPGGRILAPSAVQAAGEMWTDNQMMQKYPQPEAMSIDEIHLAVQEYVIAAKNAMRAGFDGVELHAANGYLLEQFLSPISNVRTDGYGGSVENRCRFVVEVAEAVALAIGSEKTAIRLSPYGVNSDMSYYPETDQTYDYLSKKLSALNLVYLHVVDHSAMGAPEVPLSIKQQIRTNFKNTIILCGGYGRDTAEAAIDDGLADLIAFGRPFINNPDLVYRMSQNKPLSEELNMDLFYSAEDKGYTDYKMYQD